MISLKRILFFQLAVTIANISFGSWPTFAAMTYIATPSNYRATLKTLKPGAHLQLTPGDYKNGLPIHYLRGTEDAPITISGPNKGHRAVLQARPGHNTISILNSSYVTIRALDLDGRNVPVDAVKCEGHADWAHHITLEGLRVRGHGHNIQIAGISTKCPAWGWVIRNNVIEGAGTGLYLGNSDGRAPFIAGLIEHNLIRDTLGYNLQIKQQQPRPAISGMPIEPSGTIIRHNVFSKADKGLRELARPNVLVGHWPLTGPGSDDLYFIYGNFFYQNPHESLFQAEGNVALYSNLFVNHFGDGVRIQPHGDTPRKISIFSNTIIARESGLKLSPRGSNLSRSRLVVANIIFARSPLHGASAANNLTGGLDKAADYLAHPLASLGEMNLVPTGNWVDNRALQHTANSVRVIDYPDADLDFDGRMYGTGRAGAYTLDKDRPRWLPTLEIKPLPSPRR